MANDHRARRVASSDPARIITRRHLQVVLGLIWLLDGLLQFQPYVLGTGSATQITVLGVVRVRVAGRGWKPLASVRRTPRGVAQPG